MIMLLVVLCFLKNLCNCLTKGRKLLYNLVGSYKKEDVMDTNKIAILIKKISLEFDKLSNPYFSKYDLSASQYKILKYLYSQNSGTARVVDLERFYSMTHPTTLGLLEELEKNGYTTRIDNPNDKRGKLVALTKKSKSMKNKLISLGDEIENKLTETLNIKEKQELVRLLSKLTREK